MITECNSGKSIPKEHLRNYVAKERIASLLQIYETRVIQAAVARGSRYEEAAPDEQFSSMEEQHQGSGRAVA